MLTQPPLPKSTIRLHLEHLLLNDPRLVNILPHIRHDRFFFRLFENCNILLSLISRRSEMFLVNACFFIRFYISIPPNQPLLFVLEKWSDKVYTNIYHITQPLPLFPLVILILPHIFLIVKLACI